MKVGYFMFRKYLVIALSSMLIAGSLSGCGLYSTELGHITEETAEAEDASEIEDDAEDEDDEEEEEEQEEQGEEEAPEESILPEAETEVAEEEAQEEMPEEPEEEKPKGISHNSVSSNKTSVSKNEASDEDESVSDNNADKEGVVSDPFHTKETNFYTGEDIDECVKYVNTYTYGDEDHASNLSVDGTPLEYKFYNKSGSLLFTIYDYQSEDHVKIVTADGETHNYIYKVGDNTNKYTVSRLTISQDNKAEKLAYRMLKDNSSYTFNISKDYDIDKDFSTGIDAVERIMVDAPSPYGYANIYYCEDEDDATTLAKDAVKEYKNNDNDIRLYKNGRVAVLLFSPTGSMVDALDDYDYEEQSLKEKSTETTDDDNKNPEST